MNKLITSVLSACIILSSCAKHGIDLEQITFKEDVNILIADHKKSVDQLEMLTALPGYLLTDVKNYHFGTVAVPDGGSVEFLFNSLAEKKLAGMDINFKTDTSSKMITTYLFQKYGKPTRVLQKEHTVYDRSDNAYRSTAAYLWSTIKPDVSMVLINKNEEINKQPWHTSEVIILKNDIVPASPLNNGTSLNRVIENYTPLD